MLITHRFAILGLFRDEEEADGIALLIACGIWDAAGNATLRCFTADDFDLSLQTVHFRSQGRIYKLVRELRDMSAIHLDQMNLFLDRLANLSIGRLRTINAGLFECSYALKGSEKFTVAKEFIETQGHSITG